MWVWTKNKDLMQRSQVTRIIFLGISYFCLATLYLKHLFAFLCCIFLSVLPPEIQTVFVFIVLFDEKLCRNK